ncbi:MAG: hypothetical protein OXG60_19505 [Chloroflexi bacterium]|nr:hypothetical protein [Chloroflexota bacterium]
MNPDKANPTSTQTPPALVDEDDREPTKEEILEDIRTGIIQAKAGLGRPALESLEELRREIYGDADSS